MVTPLETSPVERDLALMTLEDLTLMARQRGLRGYSTMTKTDLVDALSASTDMPEQADIETTTPPLAKTPTTASSTPAAQLESVVDATVEAPPAEAATETETPVAADLPEAAQPAFKKTWIRQELLIDDSLPSLPETYGDERMIAMVRDPFWVHAYWDLSAETIAKAHAKGGTRMALRVYDVTDLVFDGQNAHSWFEIPAPEYARSWNIQVPQDGRNYLIALGWAMADGRFLPVMRSNVVDVPIGRPSPLIADKFVELPFYPAPECVEETPPEIETPEAPFVSSDELAPPAPPIDPSQNVSLPETMFHLSTRGRGHWSADTPREGELTWDSMEAAMGSAMGSHRMGSHAVSSFAAPPTPPAQPHAQDKDFWLVANCELIVYGATEADASVTLRGQKVELRPDGTFSIRFAFPDGLHPIPIRAVNADGDMERSITITVSRDTQP